MANHTDQGKQATEALSRLFVRLAPWLIEVGTWVFGGLLALNAILIAALITVGPVDTAILIAVSAFACALPLEVAGLVMLRLASDMAEFRLEEQALQSFEDAKFPNIRAYFPPPHRKAALQRRGARITLAYAAVIAMLCIALTLTGIGASLWHMASWVAEVAVATGMIALALVFVAAAHSLPPVSEAERRLRELPRDRR